jgi:hypothetical protein
MRYWGSLVAVAASVVMLGCGGEEGANWKVLVSSSDAKSAFPHDGEARGWKIERPPRAFTADNLWQYIDGDAEKYLQAGFESVQNAAYKYQGKVEAAADVYTMKTPAAAAKVLDSEADLGSQPSTLGDGGKVYGASIVFRKGRRLVRLIAYEDDPEGRKALIELGQAIVKRLEGRN